MADVPVEPDPVIEAIKAGLDLSVLDANLRRTPQERIDNMVRAMKTAEALRAGVEKVRAR
jgi:hypothetical protein